MDTEKTVENTVEQAVETEKLKLTQEQAAELGYGKGDDE